MIEHEEEDNLRFEKMNFEKFLLNLLKYTI